MADRQLSSIISHRAIQEHLSAWPIYQHLTHVRNIKDPESVAHGMVLVDDAGILHRHRANCYAFFNNRHVEGDWWSHPIPDNVEFGEGFYCESAQIFRQLHSKKLGAVIIPASTLLQPADRTNEVAEINDEVRAGRTVERLETRRQSRFPSETGNYG